MFAAPAHLVVLPFWIGELALGRRIAWTPTTLASVALFSSVLAYIFWNRGMEAVGAQVAGLFIHLMPVFGVLLAWLFLDERLHVYRAHDAPGGAPWRRPGRTSELIPETKAGIRLWY